MPRHPMRDVIVLIPGITGSVLRKDGNIVWGFSASTLGSTLLTRGRSMREALTLHNDDPNLDDLGDGVSADAVIPDLHLLPGLWKIDGYTTVLKAIQARFEIMEGENLFRFPYDWRRDNRVAARRLARVSHSWLGKWRERTGNADARLILVAHSMGGLVSRYFLEVLEGWKHTRALITFGTPFRGSLNALDSLSNGMRKGPFGLVELSELARSFTSIYQLLPTYPCYDPGTGELVRVSEADSIPNIERARVSEATAFHREIEAAVESNRRLDRYRDEGYQIYPVVGNQQETSLVGRRNGNGVVMATSHPSMSFTGDGTVPRASATPPEMGNRAPSMYAATKHGSLQNAGAVLVQLDGLLSGLSLDLSHFRRPATHISLTVEDLVLSDEPIVVQARRSEGESGRVMTRAREPKIVRARRPEGEARLTATLTARGSGQRVTTYFRAGGGGLEVAEFGPQPEGAYEVVVSGPGVEPAADAFAVASTESAGGYS